MAVAGMVLGIVACAAMLMQRRKIRKLTQRVSDLEDWSLDESWADSVDAITADHEVRIGRLERPDVSADEPHDGPFYVALRFEKHHTKRPSGEIGKMPVFPSVELIHAKYGPDCGYKLVGLPTKAVDA